MKTTTTKKTPTPTSTRKRRLPAIQNRIIASREALPYQHRNAISGALEYFQSPQELDVLLSDRAPKGFTVSAVLQRDDSYLWIGIDPKGREPLYPFAIIKGDALRALVTMYLKHLNTAFYGDGR